MSRLRTSFVLGYHGCSEEVAARVVSGSDDLLMSDRDYDWLGPGIYFWEADPLRALEWARDKAKRGEYAVPAVVGAVIDLGNCLDLTVREDLELVKSAYDSLVQIKNASGLPELPQNKPLPKQPKGPRLLRYLDCAVIRHLHSHLEREAGLGKHAHSIRPFDTVRGMFDEGEELFPGSGFTSKTHSQIAVRSVECLKGLFLFRQAAR